MEENKEIIKARNALREAYEVAFETVVVSEYDDLACGKTTYLTPEYEVVIHISPREDS